MHQYCAGGAGERGRLGDKGGRELCDSGREGILGEKEKVEFEDKGRRIV